MSGGDTCTGGSERFEVGDRVILEECHPSHSEKIKAHVGNRGTVTKGEQAGWKGGKVRVKFDRRPPDGPVVSWFISPQWLSRVTEPSEAAGNAHIFKIGCERCGVEVGFVNREQATMFANDHYCTDNDRS